MCGTDETRAADDDVSGDFTGEEGSGSDQREWTVREPNPSLLAWSVGMGTNFYCQALTADGIVMKDHFFGDNYPDDNYLGNHPDIPALEFASGAPATSEGHEAPQPGVGNSLGRGMNLTGLAFVNLIFASPAIGHCAPQHVPGLVAKRLHKVLYLNRADAGRSLSIETSHYTARLHAPHHHPK